eukprot:141142_1
MHELRYKTIIKHSRLIQELESKYIFHINALLQQKTMIHLEIQRSLYHQLTNLDINIPLIHMNEYNISCKRKRSKEIFKKQKHSTDNPKLATPSNIFVSNNTTEIPKLPSIPLPPSTTTCTNITQLPSILNPSIPPIPDIQSFIFDPSNSNSNFSNICNSSNISNPSNPVEISDEIPVIPLSQIFNQNMSNNNTNIQPNITYNNNINNINNNNNNNNNNNSDENIYNNIFEQTSD